MEKIKALIKKYYEGLSYLFFGGVATLLNLVLFALFQAVFGTDFVTGAGNVLDNAIKYSNERWKIHHLFRPIIKKEAVPANGFFY